MIAAYLAWAAGEHADARTGTWPARCRWPRRWSRFGILTGRRTAAPVEDLLTRDSPMLACEATWLALFVAGL